MESEITPQSPCLPEEIIEEILLRLPVKSLLRFRCVSKPWRSLFGSKRFIKKHLDTSTKNPNFAHHNVVAKPIGPQRGLEQCSLISMLDDPFAAQFTSCHSMNIRWNSICIVDYCNGIVCLLLDGICFVLWNPSTRKIKQLPAFYRNNEHNWRIAKHGFGYDDSSGDYMVFGMVIFSYGGGCKAICKVYSLHTNTWKIVEAGGSVSSFYYGGKFASGKMHCRGLRGLITYFDLGSEVFDVIKEPITNGLHCRSLGVFEGRLGLLYDDRFGNLHIWVIKEYGVNASWEKVVNIPLLHTTPSYLSLLGTGPNGEILLSYRLYFEIFYPEGNGFRHCQVRDLGEFCDVIYVESLVPLQGERCIT